LHWKRSIEVRDSVVNPLKLAMILSWRSSYEYTKLGLNIEYHANTSPSAAITNDLARTLSFPHVEATTASKLMMNWRGSDLLLNLGSVMGLYDEGQGELWIPSDNGDFESIVLWTGGKVKGVLKVG
jgi:hypothetical protein